MFVRGINFASLCIFSIDFRTVLTVVFFIILLFFLNYFSFYSIDFGNIEIGEFDDNIMGQRRRVTGEEFEDDIRSAFRLIDIDADGFITIQDLYQLMMGIGEMLTDDELSELLKAADNDGDGMINYKGNIK